eukprot:3821351-Amphidinium_carterae.1
MFLFWGTFGAVLGFEHCPAPNISNRVKPRITGTLLQLSSQSQQDSHFGVKRIRVEWDLLPTVMCITLAIAFEIGLGIIAIS